MSFTPGPWIASTFGFQVLTGDSWNTICELKGSAEWEDGRGKHSIKYEWENQEANARLIAAAPDLLGALRFALNDPCFPKLGSVTQDVVRLSLSKAEGHIGQDLAPGESAQ